MKSIKQNGWIQYILEIIDMQQLFQEVANQFQSINQYDKFMKEASKEFDIKIYKFNRLTVSQVVLIYKEQCQKYESKSIELLNCAWYENQRRIYVWFVISFLHYKLLDPIKLLDQEKYWYQIRQMFWGKDIYLIKYQLQTIIKNRGRTIWKAQEDQLLKEIYPIHSNGQWNEVAKDLYIKSKGKYFKTAKQCRERWQNHLNDHIKRGDWSPQQDLTLFQQVKKNGNKWARIIPFLKNLRTEHMIKNRYKAMVNKVIQQKNIKETEAIDAIIHKLTQRCPSTSSNEKQLDMQDDNESIPYVESEEIRDEGAEMRSDSCLRGQKKRGRTMNLQKKITEGLGMNLNQANKNEVNLNNSDEKICVYQGCKFQGGPIILNQLIYVHSSNSFSQSRSSFSQSNSNRISYGNPNIFASGQQSINCSFNFSDPSWNPLDFKEENKREVQLQSIKSCRSAGERPNDSFSNYMS